MNHTMPMPPCDHDDCPATKCIKGEDSRSAICSAIAQKIHAIQSRFFWDIGSVEEIEDLISERLSDDEFLTPMEAGLEVINWHGDKMESAAVEQTRTAEADLRQFSKQNA